MKICYFGNYDPEYSRNRVIIKGLQENNHEVIQVRVEERKMFALFWKLYHLHKKISNQYDLMIIGVSDAPRSLPIFAKFLSDKPVVWDAFYSLYDSWVFDRQLISKWSPKALYYFIIEWLDCVIVDKILLDTNAHIDYFVRTFHIRKNKFIRVLVGTDPDIFTFDQSYRNIDEIKVEFHGTYIPLQGVEYIVRAAKLLENEKNISFTLLGNGQDFSKIQKIAQELKVKNILFKDRIPYKDLPGYIAEADISLGAFGPSDKSRKVIVNKIFEGAAIGRPVITAGTDGVRELFGDDENIVFCNSADPKDLADKILMLSKDWNLRDKIRRNARKVFEERCTPKIIVGNLLKSLGY